ANIVETKLKSMDALSKVKTNLEDSKKEWQIHIDQTKAEQLGLVSHERNRLVSSFVVSHERNRLVSNFAVSHERNRLVSSFVVSHERNRLVSNFAVSHEKNHLF
ncbi:hypothetical protein ACWA19_28845, partial [Bacillus toyonensis]